MRILLLNWKDLRQPDAGGAERYVEQVARRWCAEGHEVTVFVPRVAGSPAEEWDDGVRVLRAGGRHSVFALARRHLRRHAAGYDRVVESVSTRPFFAHHVAGDRALALYHQMADDVWLREFRFPLSVVGRRVVEPHWVRAMQGARVVAVSESTAQDLRRFGVDATAIVPPGSTPPAGWVPRIPGRRPRLLFLGRLIATKRPGDALRAAALVRRALPEATLDVAGDGYLAAALRRDAGDGVRFHGGVDEATKHELLRRADVLLLPGTREGWGIVALEAAGHGVPVVAYDVNGLRDAVVDGGTGLVVPPQPEAMAAAAIQLLEDPLRWRTMSAAARRRALHFTWDRAAADLMAVVAERARVTLPVVERVA
ncbi:MAG TPA: glycosyltransferase family 4 protein [Candidatus Dormibacteraeota bacterium]|nr:glycosyltransferase family 4 protein [Candidatus Dormibacteraeota bacterium]